MSLNLQTRFGVSIAVNRGEAVFDMCSVSPFIFGTSTMRAGHEQFFGYGFRISLVHLSQFMHPAIVKDSPWIIFWKHLALSFKSHEVVEGSGIVHRVGDFFGALVNARKRNLLLNHKTRQEVWCRKHAV